MFRRGLLFILLLNIGIISVFYAILRENSTVGVDAAVKGESTSPKSVPTVKELLQQRNKENNVLGSNPQYQFVLPTAVKSEKPTGILSEDNYEKSYKEISTVPSSEQIHTETTTQQNTASNLHKSNYIPPDFSIHDLTNGISESERDTEHSPSGKYAYVLPQEKRDAMKGRYLFPLPGFNGGPSFQYEQFKEAVQLAIHTNRTIVLAPFKHHRIPAGFAHTLVTFQHTFDTDVFEQFMPVTTVTEFVDICGTEIERVWTVPYETYSFERVLMTYKAQQIWLRNRQKNLIHIPNPDKVPTSEVEMWQRVFNDTADEACAMVTNPVQLTHINIPDLEKINDGIDGHLVPTRYIREAVDNILPKLCDGKPFMSLHWRNKTGERCRFGIHLKQTSRCKKMYTIQQSAREHISSALLRVMEKHDTSCLYIALPPKETQDIVPLLSSSIPRIYTMEDIANLHHSDIESLHGDDYFLSLLEQEICARSAVFIGNFNSNWSVFIRREREAFGNKTTYDIEDLPGLPAKVSKYVK